MQNCDIQTNTVDLICKFGDARLVFGSIYEFRYTALWRAQQETTLHITCCTAFSCVVGVGASSKTLCSYVVISIHFLHLAVQPYIDENGSEHAFWTVLSYRTVRGSLFEPFQSLSRSSAVYVNLSMRQTVEERRVTCIEYWSILYNTFRHYVWAAPCFTLAHTQKHICP